VELSEFVATIQTMTEDEVRRVAVELETRSMSSADEVSWWRAHITIDRAIRDRRCSRSASLAATSAAQAVVHVAEDADVMLPDPAVTAVARAAADIARAIVAGASARDSLNYLLEAWHPVVSRSVTTSVTTLVPLPSRMPVPFSARNAIAAS